MELIEEIDCNKFVAKTYSTFIMLKIKKTRNIGLPHVMCIDCEFIGFFKKIIGDRPLIGKPCINLNCKFHFMLNGKTIAFGIIFAWHVKIPLIMLECVTCFAKCAARLFLADKNPIVSLIVSMEFSRICDC